ncbi:MAG: HAMP domain-containing histidine kinase [Cryomorphaceae bacterium]|nr:HAMP domain-containing histidine kinase [Cryomorphaceae bacterium]
MKSYRRFFLLIALATVGVLTLQILLILGSQTLYEEGFNRDVSDAITKVSYQLEYDHARQMIKKFDDSSSTDYPSRSGKRIKHDSDRNFFEQALVMRRLSRLDSVVIDEQDRESLREEQQLEKRINMREIDSLLKREFSQKALPRQFEFGIVERDKLTNFHTLDFEFEKAKSQFRTLLFRHDYYPPSRTWLYVYFPNKDRFVLRRLLIVLGLSLLLMGVLVYAMLYTIRQLIQQKQINTVKTDFINNMTHEFKTPIATISLAVDALSNEKISCDQERIKYYANLIRQENRRMNAQVEQVLRLALMDKQGVRLEKEAVDIHQLIEKAINHLRLQVETRGGELVTQFEAKDSMVEVDPEQILTVFINLIDNANKYSPNEPKITVHTFNKGDKVIVQVSDTGVGMTKDMINKVFERFFRQTTGDLHDIKGHGLGLSYAREIITLHQGDISVESKPGEGSVFSVALPYLEEETI